MNVGRVPLLARDAEPFFDRKLVVGGVAAAGFVLSIVMRSRCNAALQSCPECISLGMPIECTIADTISFVAIAILGVAATALAFHVPSQQGLPV